MNSEIDTDRTEQNNFQPAGGGASATGRSKKSGRGLGCVLVLLVLVGLLFGAYLAYMKWFAQQVDPNLSDVVVKVGPDDGDATPIEEGILAGFTAEVIANADHPLDPAIELAQRGLEQMNEKVLDYTATLVKQIRYNGKLLPVDHLDVKIRHERNKGGDDFVPFSVYTKLLSPQAKLGIEAIYVDTWNDNLIAAHPNFPAFNPRLNLPVDGMLAMREQLHPITMIGMKNLLRQTIRKGERDLAHDECVVEVFPNVEIDGCKCVLIEITHPEPRDHFEFHIAKIYIDIEREVPLGYEGYLWPEEKGGEPVLFEKYIYTNLKLNVGLEDEDFKPENEAYNFPG